LFLADQSLNSAQKAYLKSKAPQKLTVLGGASAVPDAIILLIKQNSI
jgi:hypothetical protein